jgi:uncharacterized protein DUF3293
VQLAPDDPWASYGRTEVEIVRPAEGTFTVRPAPEGERGPWPWPSAQPVYVLTAWDPGPERPSEADNRERQAALEADLRPRAGALWSAVGVDPVTGHREEGVAVGGIPESAVRALGARYGQDAVFAWTPVEWAIVSCRDGRRVATGWSLASPDPGA